MVTYIFLAIVFIIYLMIGWGVAIAVCTSQFALDENERSQRKKNSFLLMMLGWPTELGAIIGLVSLYIQGRRACSQWWKPIEENVYFIGKNVDTISDMVKEIRETIKNIEKAIQNSNPVG